MFSQLNVWFLFVYAINYRYSQLDKTTTRKTKHLFFYNSSPYEDLPYNKKSLNILKGKLEGVYGLTDEPIAKIKGQTMIYKILLDGQRESH